MESFKKFNCILASFIILFCNIVLGCNKPPVEKIEKLQSEMERLNKTAAQYFAPNETGKVE